MRKTIIVFVVMIFFVQIVAQAMSLEQAKVQAKEKIILKYGKLIKEVREQINSIAGLKYTTPQEIWKIRYETLVSRIKEAAGSCPILLRAAGLGSVETLSRIANARYGSLENILLSLGTSTEKLKISFNWNSIFYQGSKNIFLMKEKYGAKAVADLWVTIAPNLSEILDPNVRDCSDIEMAFIDQIMANLQNRERIQASLCVLQCFSSRNIDSCIRCIRR